MKSFLIAFFLTASVTIVSQNNIEKHVVNVNTLQSEKLTSFFNKKIENTQFIMLGEQHGIQEVGEITNQLYNLAKPEGYSTLCIETSPFAAKMLDLQLSSTKNAEESLRKLYAKYPITIPFYNNKNDIKLFENVKNNNGEIWGIDQVFMVEFRLIFDYLVHLNDNERLKKAVKPLLNEAILGFEKTVKEKNMMAPFIFKYSDDLHTKLLSLANSNEEKNILNDLKKTKEIYTYNFQKEYYKNNNERAKLMKSNFINYYNKALQKDRLPKVVFKLGANHVSRGLTTTNVFDISNMISELAVINNKKSLHIYAIGVNGTKNLGHPFAPVSVIPFDESKKLPKEISEIIANQTKKYIIIDAEKLRSKANSLSKKMKNLVLKYDVLIYIKDCKALESFN